MWEYRQIMATAADFEAILNEMGEVGWELAYVTVLAGTSPIEMVAIMKRQRAQGEAPARQDSSFI